MREPQGPIVPGLPASIFVDADVDKLISVMKKLAEVS